MWLLQFLVQKNPCILGHSSHCCCWCSSGLGKSWQAGTVFPLLLLVGTVQAWKNPSRLRQFSPPRGCSSFDSEEPQQARAVFSLLLLFQFTLGRLLAGWGSPPSTVSGAVQAWQNPQFLIYIFPTFYKITSITPKCYEIQTSIWSTKVCKMKNDCVSCMNRTFVDILVVWLGFHACETGPFYGCFNNYQMVHVTD